ncbi:MAG TPA: GIY-YIG nuclease family protein [Bacteroidia bacterium]|nr:GIY-YIG nuclease family protein [Bacteroidia bacterium]
MKHHQYFVYIVTNEVKKVLYTGITNNLPQRIIEHYLNRDTQNSFAAKYKCHYLLYFETFKYVDKAIKREKESRINYICKSRMAIFKYGHFGRMAPKSR